MWGQPPSAVRRAKPGSRSYGRWRAIVKRRVITISAMPPPSSRRCGCRRDAQTASGGQRSVASRRASRQARTPARNPAAVATRRVLSGVIGIVSWRCGHRLPKSALRRRNLQATIEVVESPPSRGTQMAVAKLKRPKEDRLEEFAERIAAEINERAAKMTPEDRAKADSETKKIAAQVQRRTP